MSAMSQRLVRAAASVAVLGLLIGPAAAQPSSAAPRPNGHALLVGVTFYENLPKEKHLVGPANDVVLVRKLLTEKLQFDPKNIVVLSEAEGDAKAKGPNFLPTRKNIEREFLRLAERARKGDHVMIHLGGHGSQQPESEASKNGPNPEPDGLDEIFLPRDVGKWDDGIAVIKNAIIDDEMGEWLQKIRDKEALVWLTMDSCHSGTMTRGADAVKTRDIDSSEVLGIPKAVAAKAVKDAEDRAAKEGRSRGGPPPAPVKFAKPGGLVAIYAAQPNEVTLEREMPPRSGSGQIHGILTYTICQVLTEAFETSSQPITYSELARRIQSHYTTWNFTFPTPMVEGGNRDAEVLGDKAWPGRSSMVLKVARNEMTVNAGALHGLTKGSILEVTPPPGKGNGPLGYVLIKDDPGPFESDVEPCDKDGKKATTKLPNGGVCKPYRIDIGDQQLKVALDPLDADNKPLTAEQVKALTAALMTLGGENAIVKPVAKPTEAAWLVRVRAGGKEVVLTPASGLARGRSDADNKAFGPVPVGADMAKELNDMLGKIARAEALTKMAAQDASAGGSARGVRLKIEPMLRPSKKKTDGPPLPWPAPEIPVYDKDLLGVRITNVGKVPADVTVLYVDSKYQIDPLYPADGEDNRLRPGERKDLGLNIGAETVGLEQVVVLAVRGKEAAVNFNVLAQPGLVLSRGGTGLTSPLGKLLNRGMYGLGGTRGATVAEVDDYTITTVPLRVHPEKRPSAK